MTGVGSRLPQKSASGMLQLISLCASHCGVVACCTESSGLIALRCMSCCAKRVDREPLGPESKQFIPFFSPGCMRHLHRLQVAYHTNSV